MDQNTAMKLARTLDGARTLFPYYKDRYSLQLLRYAVRDGVPVSELKNSRWAPSRGSNNKCRARV